MAILRIEKSSPENWNGAYSYLIVDQHPHDIVAFSWPLRTFHDVENLLASNKSLNSRCLKRIITEPFHSPK